MRPTFHPRMVNGPFDDPGLYIPFLFENRAVLFDAGNNETLSSRDILKISHVFVTHTHMDHFIGFDRLLRLFLGREKTLCIYGPEGFLKNVEGKLAGYSWNLVRHYTNRFALTVTEVRSDIIISKQYLCQNRFVASGPARNIPFDGTLLAEPAFTVSAIILDHSLPCLGFSIKEQFHVNMMKDRMAELGLEVGPWIKSFKQALFNHNDPDSEVIVTSGKTGKRQKKYRLKDLADRIAITIPGQKITYFADAAYSPSNENKMVAFANDSDHLFIEAAFLEKHGEIARNKFHLTARQAGVIAARARAKQFTIFHFSPRYIGQKRLLENEARDAFRICSAIVDRRHNG